MVEADEMLPVNIPQLEIDPDEAEGMLEDIRTGR